MLLPKRPSLLRSKQGFMIFKFALVCIFDRLVCSIENDVSRIWSEKTMNNLKAINIYSLRGGINSKKITYFNFHFIILPTTKKLLISANKRKLSLRRKRWILMLCVFWLKNNFSKMKFENVYLLPGNATKSWSLYCVVCSTIVKPFLWKKSSNILVTTILV